MTEFSPGRTLSRRATLRLFGLGGAAALLAACQPSQPATPAATTAPPAKPTEVPKPAEAAKPAGAAPAAPAAAPAATTAPAAKAPAAAATGNAAVDASIAWAQANLPNSTPEIIREAAKEGALELVFQGWPDDAIKGMIAKFNEHYPFVTGTYTTQSAGPLRNKFNAEIASKRGIGDYWLISSPYDADEFEKLGGILPFKISQDAAFPAGAKKSGVWYAWQRQYALTAYRKGAINEEEKKLIRTYEGLGDPRFKGRLGVSDVTSATVTGQCYEIMYSADPKVWKGLAANKPTVRASNPDTLNSMLAGEFDVSLFQGTVYTVNTPRSGAPLEFVVTSRAVTGYIPGVISAVAPHPNAAKLWQDWAMTKEAQELWPSLSGAFPARSDAAGTAWYQKEPWFYDDDKTHVDLDWDAFSAKNPEIVERFNADFKG